MSKVISYELTDEKFKIRSIDHDLKTTAVVEMPVGDFMDMVGSLVSTGNPVFKVEAKGQIKVE